MRLGVFDIESFVGAGGMGEVYKAEHVLLKRPCAIKLIKAASEADTTAIARFEKEVKTTAKLTPFDQYPRKGRATGGVRAHAFLKGEDLLGLAWVGPRPEAIAQMGSKLAARRIATEVAAALKVIVSAVPAPPKTAPIVLEDDVWLGTRVTVLKGVTIGRGAVVGAGSVVTESAPAFSVVAGTPARVDVDLVGVAHHGAAAGPVEAAHCASSRLSMAARIAMVRR